MSPSQSSHHDEGRDGGPGLELSAADRRLLESLVESGFEASRMDASLAAMSKIESSGPEHRRDRERLAAITRLLGLMKDYPVEDASPSLLDATMARIDRHERQAAERLRFDNHVEARSGRRGFRISMPDFITVAAVFLIAVSVLWPVMHTMRQQSIDMACANNLKAMGYGFGNYAADNNGALPVATAGLGPSWSSRSSMLATDPLIHGSYCEAGHLSCPGHDHSDVPGMPESPSYSVRWVTPGMPVNWNTGMGRKITIIVGDLNPVVSAARQGNSISPLSASLNHRGRGQNVLLSDGSALWLETPKTLGDNIWLPREIEQQDAPSGDNEQPSDVDVFLTQ